MQKRVQALWAVAWLVLAPGFLDLATAALSANEYRVRGRLATLEPDARIVDAAVSQTKGYAIVEGGFFARDKFVKGSFVSQFDLDTTNLFGHISQADTTGLRFTALGVDTNDEADQLKIIGSFSKDGGNYTLPACSAPAQELSEDVTTGQAWTISPHGSPTCSYNEIMQAVVKETKTFSERCFITPSIAYSASESATHLLGYSHCTDGPGLYWKLLAGTDRGGVPQKLLGATNVAITPLQYHFLSEGSVANFTSVVLVRVEKREPLQTQSPAEPDPATSELVFYDKDGEKVLRIDEPTTLLITFKRAGGTTLFQGNYKLTPTAEVLALAVLSPSLIVVAEKTATGDTTVYTATVDGKSVLPAPTNYLGLPFDDSKIQFLQLTSQTDDIKLLLGVRGTILNKALAGVPVPARPGIDKDAFTVFEVTIENTGIPRITSEYLRPVVEGGKVYKILDGFLGSYTIPATLEQVVSFVVTEDDFEVALKAGKLPSAMPPLPPPPAPVPVEVPKPAPTTQTPTPTPSPTLAPAEVPAPTPSAAVPSPSPDSAYGAGSADFYCSDLLPSPPASNTNSWAFVSIVLLLVLGLAVYFGRTHVMRIIQGYRQGPQPNNPDPRPHNGSDEFY